MPSIDATSLPPPAAVAIEDGAARMQSSFRQGTPLFTREPDAAVRPRMFLLIYDRPTGALFDALRRHFAGHSADFDWTPPGESAPVRVIHMEPPTIDWQTPERATARVRLLEELAHD